MHTTNRFVCDGFGANDPLRHHQLQYSAKPEIVLVFILYAERKIMVAPRGGFKMSVMNKKYFLAGSL